MRFLSKKRKALRDEVAPHSGEEEKIDTGKKRRRCSRPAPIEASDRNAFILFTDGASKSNPGPAGAGGVLYDPAGHFVLRYYRYCGLATNNGTFCFVWFVPVCLGLTDVLNGRCQKRSTRR